MQAPMMMFFKIIPKCLGNINNTYRVNAAMYQICHCEAVGRGNLQHLGVMTAAPINIEHFGFTMLIG